jgi:serine O-acetyltransferase
MAEAECAASRPPAPSRAAVERCVDALREAFFPAYYSQGVDLATHVATRLRDAWVGLEEQLTRAFAFAGDASGARDRAALAAGKLLEQLPRLRKLSASDVDAAFEGDPALRSRDEAILGCPGVAAIGEQRLAHELHLLGVPLIPRMITEHAHGATGIDIHPGAVIGESFFVDHGTGVVIGETTRIGNRVRIYQGVTLGARKFPLDALGKPIKGVDRHPIVEDDVVIYAGATILGRITIGRGSSIGGNVWLTHSVPPGSEIAQDEGRAHEGFEAGS